MYPSKNADFSRVFLWKPLDPFRVPLDPVDPPVDPVTSQALDPASKADGYPAAHSSHQDNVRCGKVMCFFFFSVIDLCFFDLFIHFYSYILHFDFVSCLCFLIL